MPYFFSIFVVEVLFVYVEFVLQDSLLAKLNLKTQRQFVNGKLYHTAWLYNISEHCYRRLMC